MKYANGRPATINDLVLATGPSGPFLGRLTAIEGAELKVHPVYSQSGIYLAPSQVVFAGDALVPAAQIKAFEG